MYVRPSIGGKTTTLGVSGRLWRDALIMYDRASYSLWSQVEGKAVAGPANGQMLEEIPSELTSWKSWKARHPDTLVLKKPVLRGSTYADYHKNSRTIGVVGSKNPDDRLGPKVLVYGVKRPEGSFAIPLEVLKKRGVTQLSGHGSSFVIFAAPDALGAFGYERTAGSRTLTFDLVNEVVRDKETGSRWAREAGTCVEGELKGQQLIPLDGLVIYWGVWARYHRGAELLGVGGPKP